MSDLELDLSMTLKVKGDRVVGLSTYEFLLVPLVTHALNATPFSAERHLVTRGGINTGKSMDVTTCIHYFQTSLVRIQHFHQFHLISRWSLIWSSFTHPSIHSSEKGIKQVILSFSQHVCQMHRYMSLQC